MFSRKRKSLTHFFQLLEIYTKDRLSIHRLWSFYDFKGHFASKKTLQKYFRALFTQVDEMIKTLSAGIVFIQGDVTLDWIKASNKDNYHRLSVLFRLIDMIIELHHRKNISGPILESEKYSFFHFYFFRQTNKVLLDTS